MKKEYNDLSFSTGWSSNFDRNRSLHDSSTLAESYKKHKIHKCDFKRKENIEGVINLPCEYLGSLGNEKPTTSCIITIDDMTPYLTPIGDKCVLHPFENLRLDIPFRVGNSKLDLNSIKGCFHLFHYKDASIKIELILNKKTIDNMTYNLKGQNKSRFDFEYKLDAETYLTSKSSLELNLLVTIMHQ